MHRSGIPLFVFLILISCGDSQPKYGSPEGYNLLSPEKMIMKESLLEISGITFFTQDTLLAINDEEGRVFFVPWMGEKNRHVKFAHNGDFEEVTKYKDQIFVLRSNGTIFSFPDSVTRRLEAKKLKNSFVKGDYESLYADEAEDKLYVLCKTCKKKEGDHEHVHGYSISLNDSTHNVEDFNIDVSSLVFKGKKKKKNFSASSMARNKATGEWYILSAANHALLITDGEWKIKNMYLLDPEIFNQPEGIAFDSQNNLYISNEGDELQNGNILKFKLKSRVTGEGSQ